jgi:hypothetical protein
MTCLAGPSHQIVLRQKTSPVIVNSNARQAATGYLGTAANAWKSAPQPHRDGWNGYASPRSGRNAFIGAYSFAARLEAAYPGYLILSTAPPLDKGILPFVANGFRSAGASTGIIIFEIDNPSDSDCWYEAKISFSIPPTSHQNLTGFDTSRTLVSYAPAHFKTLQAFYGLRLGSKYQVSVRAVSINYVSQPLSLSNRWIGEAYA